MLRGQQALKRKASIDGAQLGPDMGGSETDLVKALPSMRMTTQHCGSSLSLSSKLFTYSYLEFAIEVQDAALLNSCQEAAQRNCWKHTRGHRGHFQLAMERSVLACPSGQDRKLPLFNLHHP